MKLFPKNRILNKGEHLGYNWLITHNGMGCRCGYVQIKEGHPWFRKDYDDLQGLVTIHGGLTFSESDEDGTWFIGFDCAHSCDMQDPTLKSEYKMPHFGGIIRNQAYVEKECLKLCEYAAAAANKES